MGLAIWVMMVLAGSTITAQMIPPITVSYSLGAVRADGCIEESLKFSEVYGNYVSLSDYCGWDTPHWGER